MRGSLTPHSALRLTGKDREGGRGRDGPLGRPRISNDVHKRGRRARRPIGPEPFDTLMAPSKVEGLRVEGSRLPWQQISLRDNKKVLLCLIQPNP